MNNNLPKNEPFDAHKLEIFSRRNGFSRLPWNEWIKLEPRTALDITKWMLEGQTASRFASNLRRSLKTHKRDAPLMVVQRGKRVFIVRSSDP